MAERNINQLREIAEKATQGTWGFGGVGVSGGEGAEEFIAITDPNTGRRIDDLRMPMFEGLRHSAANGEFIATFDPPTVLAMLDALAIAAQFAYCYAPTVNENGTDGPEIVGPCGFCSGCRLTAALANTSLTVSEEKS